MNFSQIKCFLAAAETLSFTRAADRLYLSQPVLSRQIAAMEEELDIRLFVREKKSVRLTPAGEVLSEGLRKLAGDYQSLLEKAHAISEGFEGSLNVGMAEGQLICPPYSDALKSFHEKYPDVMVKLSRHSLAELQKKLENGELDLAFGATFNVTDEEKIAYQKVARTKNYLVVPASHPKADKPDLSVDDFAEDTYLSLAESELQFIANNEGGVRPLGITRKLLVAPDIGTLALWLEAGYGIFVLNGNHALRNNPNLRFLDIPGLGETTEIVMWKRGNQNPLVEAFREQFEEIE
jgi:DNA-binding transcriptional LysR family regulator